MGFSQIFIWLWTINGWKHEYLGPIWLDYYSPYSSKIQVLDSPPSRLSAHYSAYYSTPNIGRIVVLFQIAKRGRVIRWSLQLIPYKMLFGQRKRVVHLVFGCICYFFVLQILNKQLINLKWQKVLPLKRC